MGTWSGYLACRRPADAAVLLGHGAEAWTPETAPGWSIAEVALRDFEADAIEETAGPALTAIVCDGDFADVIGTLDGEPCWRLYLNEANAGAYEAPLPAVPSADNKALHAQMALWASKAGVQVDPEALREAIATHRDPADDALLTLLAVLGLIPSPAAPRS
ncbi:hypothetical protein [Actinocorallia longicatena]|uniref:Uncharacterized protein n=1 Tax=Actinocorallia longicatena TaxID=111803 RepID=A0ABP6QF28_9ACTN